MKNVIGSETLANSFRFVCLRCCPKQADDPAKSDISFDGARATPIATGNQSLLIRFQFRIIFPSRPCRKIAMHCVGEKEEQGGDA